MNLKEYNWPKIQAVDLVFPTVDAPQALIDEARERGFYYHAGTPYNKLFSTLFYDGGEVKFKEGIDEEFKNKAWPFCRALMGSFAPKHEDKEAVCALIMSELLEV